MTQPDWSAQLVSVAAGEIRRHRLRRDMSAQQLAEACAELGLVIQRSVLANLESGRRTSLSLPELFVLAQALEVPPLLLVLPLGYAETVEVRPGVEVSITDALRWFTGERPLPGTVWDSAPDGSAIIASFQVHMASVERWQNHMKYAAKIRGNSIYGSEADLIRHEKEADRTLRELVTLRRLMRVRGGTPPPLPPEMALAEEVISR